MNSHTAKPLLYKITGVWGNHEGSMLLWCLILAFYAALAAWFGGNLSETLRARVIGVQGLISLAFLGFLIFTSNPFWRLEMPPMNGEDLNPLLQDPGLASIPRSSTSAMGLSMAFSFAVAALIEGRVDAAWGLEARYEAACAGLSALREVVDQQLTGLDALLSGAREVAFFPPMTGG